MVAWSAGRRWTGAFRDAGGAVRRWSIAVADRGRATPVDLRVGYKYAFDLGEVGLCPSRRPRDLRADSDQRGKIKVVATVH